MSNARQKSFGFNGIDIDTDLLADVELVDCGDGVGCHIVVTGANGWEIISNNMPKCEAEANFYQLMSAISRSLFMYGESLIPNANAHLRANLERVLDKEQLVECDPAKNRS